MFDHDYEAFPELTNAQMEEEQFNSPHEQISRDFDAVVERVHDGDTVTLRSGNRDFLFPLRLLDIDTRELNEDGGDTARDWLSARVLGRSVTVNIDPKNRVDKYGRLLGRIIVGGLNVADEMIALGLAVEFGRKHEGEPEPVDKIFRVGQWF